MQKLILLSSLFVASANCADKPLHNLFIQGSSAAPAIERIKQELTPRINAIVKEECGLPNEYDFNFFLPKEWQRITLYSLCDVTAEMCSKTYHFLFPPQEAGPSKLTLTWHWPFISSVSPERMWLQKYNVHHVYCAHEVALFGKDHDELVLLIDDSCKELFKLHSMLKNRCANSYDELGGTKWYNKEKSEKFEYKPHLGLGRLRYSSIKQHVKNGQNPDEVYKKIYLKVEEEAQQLLQKYLKKKTKITFESLCVFDQQDRTHVVEWKL